MSKLSILFSKYFFYILLGLLVFIPVYPKFPLINIHGTFVAIRLEDFLIGLTILVWLIGKKDRLLHFSKQTIVQAFILFWFIGALSVFSGRLITHSLTLNLGFFNWLRRIEVMMLFLVAATTIRTRRQVKISLIVMLLTTLLIIFYGFGQIWLGFPTVSTNNSEFAKGLILYLTNGARVNSTFGGHYDLAAYLSIILALISSLFFYYRKIKEKTILVISGLLSFILLGLTTARVSYVAAILSLMTSFFLNGKKIFILVVIALSILTVGFIPELRHRLVDTVTVNLLNGGGPKYSPSPGTVNIFTPSSQLTPEQRALVQQQAQLEATQTASASAIPRDVAPGEPVNTTALGVERSFDIRINVEWPRAFNALLYNPLLGTGYSSITVATDNDYLRSLGETGLLGTLSLILVFYILIRRHLNFIKKENSFERFIVVGTLCAILAILITATFIDVLESSKIAEVFWIVLGIGWAIMGDYSGDV